jgi:transposase
MSKAHISKAHPSPLDPKVVLAASAGQGERSESEQANAARTGSWPGPPDPEVRDRPIRRSFTAEYKRRILAKADAATEPGQISALLRREGLYSSHLSQWRRSRTRGGSALEPSKRGSKPRPKDPRDVELARLTRDNEMLARKLRKAELMLDLQKKVSQLLGIVLPALESDDDSSRRS